MSRFIAVEGSSPREEDFNEILINVDRIVFVATYRGGGYTLITTTNGQVICTNPYEDVVRWIREAR